MVKGIVAAGGIENGRRLTVDRLGGDRGGSHHTLGALAVAVNAGLAQGLTPELLSGGGGRVLVAGPVAPVEHAIRHDRLRRDIDRAAVTGGKGLLQVEVRGRPWCQSRLGAIEVAASHVSHIRRP